MRKFLVSALLVFSGTGAFAQIQQGTKVLSGGFWTGWDENRQTINNQDLKTTHHSLNVNPAIGLFLKENLEAGAGLNIGFAAGKGYNYNDSYPLLLRKSTGYGVGLGPYLKQYWTLTDQLYLTGMATFFGAFHSTKINVPDSPALNSTARGYSLSATLSPGLNYFISDHFSLSTSFSLVSYSHSYTKDKGEETDNSNTDNAFSFNLLPHTYTFGMGYYFNR